MIIDNVQSLEADLGIACVESVPPKLDLQPLFETSLKLIAPRKHNYWPKGHPSLEHISRAPFIVFPQTSTITPFIEKKFSEHGLTLNIVQELNNFEIVKKYVECGMGISILDDYTLTKEDKAKLGIYSLEEFSEKRVYSLIMRKRKYLSSAATSFATYLKPTFALPGHSPVSIETHRKFGELQSARVKTIPGGEVFLKIQQCLEK